MFREEEGVDHHESGPWVDDGDSAFRFRLSVTKNEVSRSWARVWAYREVGAEAEADGEAEAEEGLRRSRRIVDGGFCCAGVEVEEYRTGRAVKIRRDEDA